jgi:hypothetical protein
LVAHWHLIQTNNAKQKTVQSYQASAPSQTKMDTKAAEKMDEVLTWVW